MRDNLRLELSDLNEVKNQEMIRCLNMKRKRAELLVKVEQIKRRVLSQRAVMQAKSKEKQQIQEKINRV